MQKSAADPTRHQPTRSRAWRTTLRRSSHLTAAVAADVSEAGLARVHATNRQHPRAAGRLEGVQRAGATGGRSRTQQAETTDALRFASPPAAEKMHRPSPTQRCVQAAPSSDVSWVMNHFFGARGKNVGRQPAARGRAGARCSGVLANDNFNVDAVQEPYQYPPEELGHGTNGLAQAGRQRPLALVAMTLGHGGFDYILLLRQCTLLAASSTGWPALKARGLGAPATYAASAARERRSSGPSLNPYLPSWTTRNGDAGASDGAGDDCAPPRAPPVLRPLSPAGRPLP